jgi:4-amino-4-deoxy-L-arabinose transferase-like glycosyltransferase
MNKFLAVATFLVALSVVAVAPLHGAGAVLICLIFAVLGFVAIKRLCKIYESDDFNFLAKVFVAGLLLRIIMATFTFNTGMYTFFGGDTLAYDVGGDVLSRVWWGVASSIEITGIQFLLDFSGSGWGMTYVVAAIYFFVGRNILALQFFTSVAGALTAPLAFFCAYDIFQNRRVAKISCLAIAFFPSLIIWSSQGLKDGMIVFLLMLAMVALLQILKQFNVAFIIVLFLALFGIFALRFYLFFALVFAIVGSFVISGDISFPSFVRRVAAIVVLGSALMLFGVTKLAERQTERFDLNALNDSRSYQAKTANSGFGEELDVSTPEGALQALPIGFIHLMFAPFPWQINSVRQLFTLPEMLIWWSSLPFLVMGISYTLKYRLKKSIAILLFTSLLTIAYSIFQGDIGTAYRMRSQLLIFYLMFVAAGYVLFKEKRENARILANLERTNRNYLVS